MEFTIGCKNILEAIKIEHSKMRIKICTISTPENWIVGVKKRMMKN